MLPMIRPKHYVYAYAIDTKPDWSDLGEHKEWHANIGWLARTLWRWLPKETRVMLALDAHAKSFGPAERRDTSPGC